jgi:hypothetical protein
MRIIANKLWGTSELLKNIYGEAYKCTYLPKFPLPGMGTTGDRWNLSLERY